MTVQISPKPIWINLVIYRYPPVSSNVAISTHPAFTSMNFPVFSIPKMAQLISAAAPSGDSHRSSGRNAAGAWWRIGDPMEFLIKHPMCPDPWVCLFFFGLVWTLKRTHVLFFFYNIIFATKYITWQLWCISSLGWIQIVIYTYSFPGCKLKVRDKCFVTTCFCFPPENFGYTFRFGGASNISGPHNMKIPSLKLT